MTEIQVDDKTGCEPEVAARIEEILTEAAPLVEKITSLSLPAPVLCELHQPDGMAREVALYLRGALQRDTAGLTLSNYQRRQIAMTPGVQGKTAAHRWAGTPTNVVTNSIFQPRLLIVPNALKPQDPGAPARLYEHVVHILVMAGQITASRGAVVPPKEWPPSRVFGFQPARFVMTGHSEWASREVCSLLAPPTASSASQQWTRRAASVLAAPLRPLSDESRTRKAAAFVRRAIEAGGVETFNRVWNDPRLLPTRDERPAPELWVQRISR